MSRIAKVRIQKVVTGGKGIGGEIALGFYKKGACHVVDIANCMIADEKSNDQIATAVKDAQHSTL